MVAIWRDALSVFRESWKSFLVLAVALVMLEAIRLYLEAKSSTLLIGWLTIVFVFHRISLFPGGFGLLTSSKTLTGKKIRYGGFILVSILILVFVFGISIFALWQMGGLEELGRRDSTAIGILIILNLIANWITLSAFGTALPAAAAQDRFGFALTLSRARKTAWSIAWGLLLGPFLATVILLGLSVLLRYAIGQMPDVYSPTGGLSVKSFLISIPFQLSWLFISFLSVTVLCRAYRRVAPDSIAVDFAPDRAVSGKVAA